MEFIESLILLTISLIILLVLTTLLSSKKRISNQLSKAFGACIICMVIWTVSLMLQIIFQNTAVNPVLFEGFASFGACFIPVAFMFLTIIFAKTKITFKKTYVLLFIIPILSTVLMFTNSLHNLFYKVYSTNLNETVYGPYMPIHSVYSYVLLGIGLLYLFRFSFKNSGFFSKQSILIFLGALFSVLINMIGAFNIVNMSIYITPISFTV